MTPRDLAYWLQGYFELTEERGGYGSRLDVAERLVSDQFECIKRHIELTISDSGDSYFTSSLLATPHDVWPNLVSAYFEHVIDKEHPAPEVAQLIHDKPGRPHTLRC